MSKDIETLDNNKARACEVWALRIKKVVPQSFDTFTSLSYPLLIILHLDDIL